MASTISYINLVNFAKFIAGENNDKYNNMYALRGYNLTELSSYEDFNKSYHTETDTNTDKVTKKDFDVLLMILSGAIDNNNYNFGADCGIIGAPICSFRNPNADTIDNKEPRYKIKINNKNFSKCIYQGESLNINQNTSNILNNTLIVNPDEEDPCHIDNITDNMCPDDTHFYWDTSNADDGFAGNFFNYFTDEKAKPGQCVKRYGASPGSVIDPTFKSIVDNDPHKDKLSNDGRCMAVGTVMKDSGGQELRTVLPDDESGKCKQSGCVINKYSSNELARECANADGIYYNDDDYYTIPSDDVLTQNCRIYQTNERLIPNDTQLTQSASRQDIIDRGKICRDSQKPYYNAELDINNITKDSYDIPEDIIDTANGITQDTWWDENTCRYVYEIPLKTELGQTYENNEIWHPPLFNGECSISNLGNNYALDSNSQPNSSDYESIGLFVEEDILNSIKNPKNNSSPIEHPFYSSSTEENIMTGDVYEGIGRSGESLKRSNDQIAETKCIWLPSNKGTYKDPGNTTDNSLPQAIDSQKAGNFFKYVKNVDNNQHKKEPNFYTNSLEQNKMIPHGKWRQVDVCDGGDKDKGFGYQEQTQGVLHFDETGGKWYNNSNFSELEPVHQNNNNTLYKLKTSQSSITSNSSGTGPGKCLRRITINKLPQYVRDPDDTTIKFTDTGDEGNRVNETHLETQFGDDLHNIYNNIYKKINENELKQGNSLYYTIDNRLCGVGAFTNELKHENKFNEGHSFNNVTNSYLQLAHAWIGRNT